MRGDEKRQQISDSRVKKRILNYNPLNLNNAPLMGGSIDERDSRAYKLSSFETFNKARRERPISSQDRLLISMKK
jgi:hypothetical protein